MAMDFCGFTWKGKHSDSMGIKRVSDGSRYNDTIIPSFSDTTATVPGADGVLYWESFYSSKPFPVNIAFDSLTEAQYRKLRNWLNAKDRGELIFDEEPYKAYTVKVKDPPQLKTICFMEGGERVYKGEGAISFVAYYPFARGVYKFIDDKLYKTKKIVGEGENEKTVYEWKDSSTGEWIGASGLIENDDKAAYNSFSSAGNCNLYNAGDLSTDFKLIVSIENNPTNITLKTKDNETVGTLNFSLTAQGGDTYVRFNSATQLIEGLTKTTSGEIELTGNLYNKYIISGDWFKIPLGKSVLSITEKPGVTDNPTIDYDYLYY